MKTQRYVSRSRTVSVAMCFVLILLSVFSAQPVQAAPIVLNGPSSNWVTVLSGIKFDPGQDKQAQAAIDLVGNATNPLMYMWFDDNGDGDATNDQLALRIRVDEARDNQSRLTGYLWMGIDLERDGDLDVFLMLDAKNGVYKLDVYTAGNDANNSPSTSSIQTPVALTTLTLNTDFRIDRVTDIDAGGTASVDGDANLDDFVSFRFNFKAFADIANLKPLTGGGGALIGSLNGGAGLTKNTPLRYVIASAQQTNALNGDLAGYGSGDSSNTTYADQGAFSPVTALGDPDGTTIPVRITLTGPATVNAGVASTNFTLTVVNGDGNAVNVAQNTTFTLSSNSAGTVTFAPVSPVTVPNGSSSVTFTYTDSAGSATAKTVTATWASGGPDLDNATHNITVNSGNNAPTFPAGTQSQTINEGAGLAAITPATDADGHAITYSVTAGSLPPGLTMNADGTFSGTATYAAAAGSPYAATVTANDGNGGTGTVTLNVTVNNVDTTPTLDAILNRSNPVGATVNVATSGADVDGDTLTYSALNLPGGLSINAATGAITGTVAVGAASGSPYSTTVTVTDNTPGGAGGDSASRNFTWTISATNNAPVYTGAATNTAQTINEGQGLTALAATDADGDSLAFTLTGGTLPAGITLNADGTFSGTASYASAGNYSVNVQASDGLATVTTTLAITVNNVDTTPTLAAIANQTHAENAAVNLTTTGADVDGDTLTYSATNLPPGLSINAATGAITGTITGAGAAGSPYNVTVTVTDNTPGGAGGDSANRSLSWTVTNVNGAPSYTGATTNTSQNINEGGGLTALAATDPDGDALTYTLTGGSLPPGITLNANGTFTGAASPGAYTATIQVADGNGGTATTTLTVNVAANPPPRRNDPPYYTGNPNNTRQTIMEGGGLGCLDARDPEGYALTYRVAAGSLPPGIALTSAGCFTGTVPTGGAGEYTVTIEVEDIEDGWATTSLAVTVQPLTGCVTGVVTTDYGGKAENITVQVQAADGTVLGTATTAADGTYTICGLPPGTHDVVIPIPGSPPVRKPVTVPGGGTARVDMTLPSTATLTLTADPPAIVGDGVSVAKLVAGLKRKDGTPVVGSKVLLSTTAGILSAASTTTGSGGNATVNLTAPFIQGIEPKVETLTARVHDVALGLFAEANIKITFLPASVSGIILDTNTGKPIAGAVIEINEDFDGDGTLDYTATVTTGGDGRYQIVVPRGDWVYRLTVTAPVRVGNRTVLIKSTQLGDVGRLQGVGERFPAKKKISGLLMVAGENPDNPLELSRVFSRGETVVAAIRSTTGAAVDRSVRISAATGLYEVEDVPVGQYVIVFQVFAPNGTRLAGIAVKVGVDQDGVLALNTSLIDPYGNVTDAVTGMPIPGAKMTLYWADTILNRQSGRTPHTTVPLPLLPDFPPNINANPQITTASGQYAWMVFPDGDYYMIAEAPGYATYDSRNEGRNVPAGPGEDSYVANGVIHVGQTIVEYHLQMQPGQAPTPAPAPTPLPNPASPTGPAPGPAPAPPPPTAPPFFPPAPTQPGPSPVDQGHHFRYILGYPDGQFKPERPITRAEVAAILVRLVGGQATTPDAAPYRDVARSHWAAGSIQIARQRGLMTGDDTSGFRPDAPITRAEVTVVSVRFKGLQPQSGGFFTDTRNHWAQGLIETARQAGLIQGFADGTFRPEQSTSRAEFVTIMNRMLGRGPLVARPGQRWPDVDDNYWATGHIDEASISHRYDVVKETVEHLEYEEPTGAGATTGALGLGSTATRHSAYVSGYPDGLFRPDKPVTRAEVAVILVRLAAPNPPPVTGAPFLDVPVSHWAAAAIARAREIGLMAGNPDGRFRPDDPFTRAELAVIVVRAKGLQTGGGQSFADTAGHWATASIEGAKQARYLQGFADGRFRPQQATTRAEFVTVANRLLGRGPLTGRSLPRWLDVPALHWAAGQIEEASTNHWFTFAEETQERWAADTP